MLSLLKSTHPEWQTILENALSTMDPAYLKDLQAQADWLPGPNRVFAAFSQPLSQLRCILLGESPYPRAQSANGYAFWDNAVQNLWGEQGLSKPVNRATSLRNFVKMLLVARGDLQQDLTKTAIAQLDKTPYLQTCEALFQSLINHGFLLLNATLVYRPNQVAFHAKQWQSFLGSILIQLAALQTPLQMLLFGQIAAKVPETERFTCLRAEHPYNISFINNPDVLAFFKPLNLLDRYENKQC